MQVLISEKFAKEIKAKRSKPSETPAMASHFSDGKLTKPMGAFPSRWEAYLPRWEGPRADGSPSFGDGRLPKAMDSIQG
jgi:hypothetical protein